MASQAPQFAWQTDLTRDHREPGQDARSDLEKQAAVLGFLRARVGSAPMSAQFLAHAMGPDRVDLTVDGAVDRMVRANPRIRVSFDDEMEARYEYVSAHGDVHDATSLVAFVSQQPDGVAAAALHDAYVGAARDVERAVVAGAVLAVDNKSAHKPYLFPRGSPYLVRLAGTATYMDPITLLTMRDLRAEIRRGDALRCREGPAGPDRWFRVGSRVYGGSQPRRAERPLSASSLRGMHSSNNYADPFTELRMPIAPPLPVINAATLQLAKHGCTNDVRALWLETAADTPVDGAQLERKLAEAKLSGPRRPTAKRPKKKALQDGAKKRRRVATRFQRLTNTHLLGTPIGDVLAAAMEGAYGDEGAATGGARFDG